MRYFSLLKSFQKLFKNTIFIMKAGISMKNKDIGIHIGNMFHEYRLKNNLTQNQVAEYTGLEPRHISQIERGLSKGSIDTLLKLCNAYSITPDVVLYDLLDDKVKNNISIYDENFKKLNLKDKQSINHFIEFFLKQENEPKINS